MLRSARDNRDATVEGVAKRRSSDSSVDQPPLSLILLPRMGFRSYQRISCTEFDVWRHKTNDNYESILKHFEEIRGNGHPFIRPPDEGKTIEIDIGVFFDRRSAFIGESSNQSTQGVAKLWRI